MTLSNNIEIFFREEVGLEPKAEKLQQIGLRLPQPLRKSLQQFAAANDRTLSDEIRTRLERSFANLDPNLEKLFGAIREIASGLEIDAPWHKDKYSFDIFEAFIIALLAGWRDKPSDNKRSLEDRMIYGGANQEAATVGKALAASVLRDWSKRAFAGAKEP